MRPFAYLLATSALVAFGCSGDDETQTQTETLPLDPVRPEAPAAGSACELAPEGVMTIERPMFPGRESSPTFGYSFKLFPGTDPTLPTVIYLPGGPGQPGIEEARSPFYAPAAYSLVETDLRGVGCNAAETPEHYPPEFYTSRNFADDVLAIVETLGLDNYLVYGISYGTMLGTMVVNLAEARGLPAPRGLVLEGVLGVWFNADRSEEDAFIEGWREVRDALDPAIQSQFFEDPLPLDLTPQQWGAAIQGSLPLGALPATNGVPFLQVVLSGLSPAADEAQRQDLRATLVELGESPVDTFGVRLHHDVTCREIAEDDFGSFLLEAGELVPTDYDCADIEVTDPFDAAEWPVQTPIYYFSGSADPNTPPWQAQWHFDAESTAPRQLVHVDGGGHNPRGINLVDCNDALWQSMATATGFEAALDTCTWPTSLDSAGAAQ